MTQDSHQPHAIGATEMLGVGGTAIRDMGCEWMRMDAMRITGMHKFQINSLPRALGFYFCSNSQTRSTSNLRQVPVLRGGSAHASDH